MPQPHHRRCLSLEDIHLCQQPEAVLQLFNKLGYHTEADLVSLPVADIGFAPTDAVAIKRLFLIADHDRQLQIVLFELHDTALFRLRSLAANFLNRGGHYLLVATADYNRLIFVNPRREGNRVKICKLVVDTHHPTRHDVDVLEALATNGRFPDDLYRAQCEAFDVEKVTNRFYHEYATLFHYVEEEIQENNKGSAAFYEHARLHAFAQRLLCRLMFLYFIQKKGWLANDIRFLTTQYRSAVHDESNYYALVLEPLFFETLNARRANDASRWGPIPYLNGGLFDKDYDFIVHLPNDLFDPGAEAGILGFFNNYNFTVAEDTPLEQEVAVDPEMLGKVFENMMEEEERGKSGTFYTPRPIVHYMCREALLGYMLERTGLDRDLLTSQFDEDSDRLITVSQARTIEQALDDVRVLDPAVGTGAFLVGILHELVALKRACFRARSVPVPRSSSLVAEWKRHFIAEALHGVDIKPEAIEIAKLRLWLSLVVNVDRDQVEPLPNLDYKLMVGDSLLETLDGEPILTDLPVDDRLVQSNLPGVPAPANQLRLDLVQSARERSSLHILKEHYFSAETRDERSRLRQRIEEQERTFVLTSVQEKMADIDTRIATLVAKGSQVNWRGLAREKQELDRLAVRKGHLADLAADVQAGRPLPFFLYRLHFFEVFRDKGGFDIVIANPPYVRHELISDQKPALKAAYPSVYDGVADLYVYFYARGLELLKPGGMLAFISSNKFMRAGYGEKLRRLLAEKTALATVMDFGDLPVFEATTYPCIVITHNALPSTDHAPHVLTVDDIHTLECLDDEAAIRAWPMPLSDLRNETWTLTTGSARRLLDTLQTRGAPLEDYVEGHFFNGIKTGLNEAFVLDEETRARLISEDERTAELVRPWLQGKDIDRWVVRWPRLYVLYVTWNCPIAEYPVVEKHLASYREALDRRDSVQNGTCPWYALSRPRTESKWAYDQPKIVWPNLCLAPEFAEDTGQYYVSAPANVLPVYEARLYLLGLLNSTVTKWLMKMLAAERAGQFIEYKPVYVGQIPIPEASVSDRQTIERLVRQLLDRRGEGAEAAGLEAELNERVCRLFGLTREEIGVIESH